MSCKCTIILLEIGVEIKKPHKMNYEALNYYMETF